MSGSQTPNIIAEISQPPKLGKAHLQGQVENPQDKQSKAENVDAQKAVSWFVLEEKDGEFKLTAAPNTYQVDVTAVSIHPEEIPAPAHLSFFGYKIDLGSKIELFKENYIKNYGLTKSHNLMVARFAELKTAFYGYLLSILGCTSEDIRKLQKKALEGSIKQNKAFFEENEYNGELLAIVGGGGRKIARQQDKIIGEIRKQLVAQAKNLGLGDYYTRQKIVEIQIAQCQKILYKFQEEKANLEYQMAYMGVN